MNRILTGLLAIIALNSQAQRGDMQQNSNNLLNQSFWQTKPNAEALKAEIAKGNDPAQQNQMAMDPVVLAIQADAPNESIVYLLDQKGNPPTKLTHDSRTYLFWAAAKGNVEIMKTLFAKGATAKVEDSHGMTPLNFAAAQGQPNTEVYDLCLQHGANLKADLNHDGANALLLAVAADTSLQLTDYFQSKGLDIKSKDAEGRTAFDYAARSGNIALMNKLLKKGVSFTSNAIVMAAQGFRRNSNSLETYQYLVGLGIKANATAKNGENALHVIVRRPGQVDIIKYFLSNGVDVNTPDAEGNSAFLNAAGFNRDIPTIELLKPQVKDINYKNKNGYSALALAVRGNSIEAITYLLDNGADIQTVDAKGNNLVYHVFDAYNPRQGREFEPKLKLLQAKGLNIASPQKDGNTAYHLAVAKGDLSLIKILAAYGVDVNAKNAEGLTALHKAAMMAKDASIMEYLLSIGAKKDAKTSFDETAYDLARQNELLVKKNVSVDFLKL